MRHRGSPVCWFWCRVLAARVPRVRHRHRGAFGDSLQDVAGHLDEAKGSGTQILELLVPWMACEGVTVFLYRLCSRHSLQSMPLATSGPLLTRSSGTASKPKQARGLLGGVASAPSIAFATVAKSFTPKCRVRGTSHLFDSGHHPKQSCCVTAHSSGPAGPVQSCRQS